MYDDQFAGSWGLMFLPIDGLIGILSNLPLAFGGPARQVTHRPMLFSKAGMLSRSIFAMCGRACQRDKTTWDRMRQIAGDWLPKPKILHPWPSDRFAVKYPRWKPYAGKPHVRLCAGGAQ